jgi:hypothetical protein
MVLTLQLASQQQEILPRVYQTAGPAIFFVWSWQVGIVLLKYL